ncbi:MAG: bifunctional phosphoglucose/phosphomannose isomerase [Chitinophagales bacterium]|nr:bifunctional phosphoglucose/phosphomannose isomerase [Chitinophagales bacterium]
MTMDQLILNFSNQLKRAKEIGEAATINAHSHEIRNVFISGLGGSGIGGTIVAQLVQHELSVPVIVNKDYFVPAFVGQHTLVIISSYSGNTEETINVLKTVQKTGAKVVIITSGGQAQQIAQEQGYDHIIIDGGMPPRSCFGYSFVQQFYILHGLGLINDGFKADLNNAIHLLEAQEAAIQIEAEHLAKNLKGYLPIIYSDASYEGVAIRFRQQINENSKMLCWHHVIPEMNHNELVGWRAKHSEAKVVFLRNETDYVRNQERMEFLKSVVKGYCGEILEVHSKGNSPIERTLYLIHLTDWVSQYLGVANGFDPIEIDVINHLKSTLATNPL